MSRDIHRRGWRQKSTHTMRFVPIAVRQAEQDRIDRQRDSRTRNVWRRRGVGAEERQHER